MADGTQQMPPRPRDVDNRPAWQSREDRNNITPSKPTQRDTKRKKPRIWVFTADIMVSDTKSITPPMPLDVDNGLPGIELWFGTSSENECCFICHMDTCAAMNTGNLTVHKWVMTTYPELVAEYIQFDDQHPFEPLQLHCAVEDLASTESMHGKLTAIVRYWMRYELNGKKVLLSFGLGDSVAVNSIVGIPTIKSWKSVFDFGSDTLVAKSLNREFPLIYEATKHGLPPGVNFSSTDFVRPIPGCQYNATALLTNLNMEGDVTPITSNTNTKTPSGAITQTTSDGCERRHYDASHIH